MLSVHGGYDYTPDPFKPMDPRFHPLAQPGNNRWVYSRGIAGWVYKVHPRLRVSGIIILFMAATRAMITFVYPYPARNTIFTVFILSFYLNMKNL